MAGLVTLIALITLIGFVVHYRTRGTSWLLAVLTGVKHTLVGMIALSGVLVLLAVGVGTTRAILYPVAHAMNALYPDTELPAARAGRVLAALPTEAPPTVTPPLPTPTPRPIIAHAPQPHVWQTPTSLSYDAMGAPLRTPVPEPEHTPTSTPEPVPATLPTTTPVSPPPTATPAASRTGCDPAYPDARTCIPPGPPWDQGCAITDERRFEVLSPDPQRLDHDGDGIGCEPVS